MSKKMILYNFDPSSPVRAVKIVAKILGLELELRDVNLLEHEHLAESFLKLNPEHTVPTLIDNGFVIWDSHAICTYLIDKYGEDDALYPKDLQLRARCNQRLFFDAASLFPRLFACGYHVFFHGGTEITKDKTDPMYSAYEILEAFLAEDPFLVGNNFTIADICVALTLSYLVTYAPLKEDKHSKILAWLNRVDQTIPFFAEFNTKFKNNFHESVLSTLEKNKQI
ncbi:glutathione S-transferase 1-like [Sitodiplosis mosellana]|uniref:glutathione S-transferase 1-like n=1 Tax=Sitodiplosis mosellana TaxID=263140 RepID=UPI0024450CAF|nr:glutathione S-transferase 1-like [Sitodiplosis mosellana]